MQTAVAHGFSAVALEYDDFQNESRWPAFRDACRAAGVKAGSWVTQGGNLRISPVDADFYVAEIEGDKDYWGVMDSIAHIDPFKPRAIITTFDGLLVLKADGSLDGEASRARCKPLNDAGFDVQTEFYLSGLEPDAQPVGLEFVARTHCGFTTSVSPVFGYFGGYGPADYAKWADTPGWGVWLAEFL